MTDFNPLMNSVPDPKSSRAVARPRRLGWSVFAAFAIGTGGGAFWGYPAGRASAAATIEEDAEELETLRRLALDAPIHELLKAAPFMMYSLQVSYGRHPELWVGLDRLAEHLSIQQLDKAQKDLVYVILDVLQYSAYEGAASRQHWRPVLRALL